MFYAKDHKTLNMFDPLDDFGPRRRALLERSWAKLFRDVVLPELPVEKVRKNYHMLLGRPTKELHAMLGLMILQQMFDYTDEETTYQFAFNRQWHYALGIESESDEASYLCQKTLWNIRSMLCRDGLYTALFESVTGKLAEVFSVDPSRQRLDSTHLFSNMRHLGRISIFTATIKKFLKNLKRHHKDLFLSLDEEIVQRYLTKQGEALFPMVKPSESAKTLEVLAQDLYGLVLGFKETEAVTGMSSYRLIVRVLSEQCIVREGLETGGRGWR